MTVFPTSQRRRAALGALMAASLFFGGALAHAQQAVTLGYSGPLSGGAAAQGRNALDGMKLAVDEINASGFEVGAKAVRLEIAALNDQRDPSSTAFNFERFLRNAKPPAVLTPHLGGAFAIQSLNEQSKVLLLATTSAPAATERGNRLTARVAPDSAVAIPEFVRHAMARQGKKLALAVDPIDLVRNGAVEGKRLVLSVDDPDHYRADVAQLKQRWTSAGGAVVADVPLQHSRFADVREGIGKALAVKPDVLVVGGSSVAAARVVRQARELGFRGGFIVLEPAMLDEVASALGGFALLEGAVGVLPASANESAEARAFAERFRRAHHRSPGPGASLAYTATHAAALAMKLSGDASDGEVLRAHFEAAVKALPPERNPDKFHGMDERGGLLAEPRIAVVEGGGIKAGSLPGTP